MFGIVNKLDEITELEDLDELKDILENLFNDEEKSEDERFEELLEKCVEDLEIKEELIDKDSLRKAIKKVMENDNLNIVPDYSNFDLDKLLPLHLESTDKTPVELTNADVQFILGVLKAYKPEKIIKRLIKKDVIRDTPFTDMAMGMLLHEIIDKFENAEYKLESKILMKCLKDGEKMTFKVE